MEQTTINQDMHHTVIERCCELFVERLRKHARSPENVTLDIRRVGENSEFVVSFSDNGSFDDRATLQIALLSLSGKHVMHTSELLKGEAYSEPFEVSDDQKKYFGEWWGRILLQPRLLELYRGPLGAEIIVVKFRGNELVRDVTLSTETNPIQRLFKRKIASLELPSICITDPTEDLMRAYDIAVRCNERSRRL